MVSGMTDKDFHADFYLSTGNDICKTVKANEAFDVPLYISIMSGKAIKGNQLFIEYAVDFTDKSGETQNLTTGKMPFDYSKQ